MLQPGRTAYVAAILLAAAGCGGSTTVPSATSQMLHGEVSDPIGDALSDSRVPVSPDLVRVTADVVAGNITFVIQFAPSTFDPQTTLIQMNLDTDQDASTGVQQGSVGADYAIDLNPPLASQAAILKAGPVGCRAFNPCFNAVASVPITFIANGMQATVPLSLLGNDDGRMNFRVISYAAAATVGGLPSSGLDVMPDANLPPGRIQ